MNQHSKRAGRANGKGVDEVQRGATRPAAVGAIVLCVGFAVAMVAISSCRKPRSHQEMQPQPNAAVQSETPKPETESPEPETETPESGAVSPVSVPHRALQDAPSTAAPISQASPAAGQLMANSPTPVQGDQSYDFSHDLNAEPVTFEAANPTTKVPGNMTATVTGTFRGNRLGDGESTAGSHLEAIQRATFNFVPSDRYSASYSATVNTLNVSGDTTNDSIHLDFGLETTASDGSSLKFTLREVVTITEDGAHVTFEQLK